MNVLCDQRCGSGCSTPTFILAGRPCYHSRLFPSQEIAVDCKRAAKHFTGVRIEPWLGAVPVESKAPPASLQECQLYRMAATASAIFVRRGLFIEESDPTQPSRRSVIANNTLYKNRLCVFFCYKLTYTFEVF